MKEDTRTTVLSVPIDMSDNVVKEEKPVLIPFPERGPEMTRLQAWWKYNTTKDRFGRIPIETERNYKILGFCYLGLTVLTVFSFILILN